MSTDEQDWARLKQAIHAARAAAYPKRARFARELGIDDSTLQILEGSRTGRPSESMLDFVTGRLGWPAGHWRSILEGGEVGPPPSVPPPTPNEATLSGAELKRLREARGLTQQELATAIGVGMRTIGNWERGETIPRNRLGMLRDYFGIDAAESADPISAASDVALLAELMRRAASRERATG